jgi:hypothetical protein
MFYTHEPVINKVLLAATLFAAASFFLARARNASRQHERRWLFIAALLGGSWLAFNQQIVTGREIWYPHFVQYTIPLSLLSVIAAGYFAWRPLFPKIFRWGLYAVISASLVYGLISIGSYQGSRDVFLREQTYAPLFSWLNANANKDCVVFVEPANDELERLIPGYTSCNTYSTVWTFAGEPRDRILHNFLLRMRLQGVTPDSAETYLAQHETDVRSYFFDNWQEMFGQGNDEWLTSKIGELASAYRNFYAGDPEAQLRSFKVDYMVSEGPLPETAVRLLPGLTLKAEAGASFIYSF